MYDGNGEWFNVGEYSSISFFIYKQEELNLFEEFIGRQGQNEANCIPR